MIKHIYFVFLLFFGRSVFGDNCYTYNFDDGNFEEEFSNDFGICNSNVFSSWYQRLYESTTVERFDPESETFITPGDSISCIASFDFPMSSDGVIEINVYLESQSLSDTVQIVVNEIIPGGNDGYRGGDSLLSNGNNNGWHTLRIELDGDGTYNGYITFTGIKSENSILLIDSFRYIPPETDISDESCLIYNPVGAVDEDEDDNDGIDSGGGNSEDDDNSDGDDGIDVGGGNSEDGDGDDESDGIDAEGDNSEDEDGDDESGGSDVGDGNSEDEDNSNENGGVDSEGGNSEDEDDDDDNDGIDTGGGNSEDEDGDDENDGIDAEGGNSEDEGNDEDNGGTDVEDNNSEDEDDNEVIDVDGNTEEENDTDENVDSSEGDDNNTSEENDGNEIGGGDGGDGGENNGNTDSEDGDGGDGDNVSNGNGEDDNENIEVDLPIVTPSEDCSFWNPLTISMVVILCLIVLGIICLIFYELGRRRAAKKQVPQQFFDVDDIPSPVIVPRVTKVYNGYGY